jgi:hypothetical protein
MSEQRDAQHERHSHESVRALFERVMRLLNEHDVRHIPVLYTDDIEYRDDGWPEVLKGHAGMERLFTALWQMSPDCRFELLEGPYLAEDGHHAGVLWRLAGTMTGSWQAPGSPSLAPTGTRFATEIAGFYELEGDRVRFGRIIVNQLDTGIQLGAMPAPDGRG